MTTNEQTLYTFPKIARIESENTNSIYTLPRFATLQEFGAYLAQIEAGAIQPDRTETPVPCGEGR